MPKCTVVVILLALLPGCGRNSPTSPSGGASAVRIVGLTNPVAQGSTIQLQAEVVGASGSTAPCTATWSSDDANVATVSPSGLMTGLAPGYTNISATCRTIRGTSEAKIEAPNPYGWEILVRDAEWAGGVWSVTMEFVDGPRRGEKVPFDSVCYVAGNPTWPVKVRLTAPDYEPLDLVLTRSTVSYYYQLSPVVDFYAQMRFSVQPNTDTHVGVLDSATPTVSHAFTARTSGNISIRSWWQSDDDVFTPWMELWCDGQRLFQRPAPYKGEAIVQAIANAAACEVKMTQSRSKAKYRVAITYPH